jgi:hypothetical protein
MDGTDDKVTNGDGSQSNSSLPSKPLHSKVAQLRAEEGGDGGWKGNGGGGGGRSGPWRTSANEKNTRRKTVFLGRRDSTGGMILCLASLRYNVLDASGCYRNRIVVFP